MVLLAAIALAAPAWGRTLVLAVSPALQQTGLPDKLAQLHRRQGGAEVRVLVAPVGKGAEGLRRAEADVLLLQDPAEEKKLLAQGAASRAVAVMANEFLLVGPKADPAGARGKDVVEALRKVDANRALFISRGDGSIAHTAELGYWALAGVKARKGGYRECKCGMGGALDIAALAYGYAVADKGTWAAFRNRGELEVLVEGDPRLRLPYVALAAAPERFGRNKTDQQKAADRQRGREAQALAQWLAGPEARKAIAAHLVGGQPFFFVD